MNDATLSSPRSNRRTLIKVLLFAAIAFAVLFTLWLLHSIPVNVIEAS